MPLSIYLLLPASTINGDGLAYYYCVLGSDWKAKFLPGHILYCPLMTVVGRLADVLHPASLRHVMLLVDQVAGALSVYLLFRVADRLGINPFGQWVAALGLAFSFGFWIQAIDVETYALAVLFLIAGIDQLARYAQHDARKHLLLLGAMNSIAALFHLATIFFVATSVCFVILRERHAPRRMFTAVGVYLGAVVLFFALPVLIIGSWVISQTSPSHILGWLKSSEHGYRVILDTLSIPRALYGLARTFVFLEFFYEASKWAIAIKGLGLLAAAAWIIWRIRPVLSRLTPTGRAVLGSGSLFVVSQAVLGVHFFGSDTERWIFIAPLIWLALAGHLGVLETKQKRVAVLAICIMFTINLVQGIWPAATDASAKARVLALDKVLSKQAVIITPGQDWVDYYHYFTSKHIDRATLIGLAIRYKDDHLAFYEHLDRQIRDARQAGKDVATIRILDPSENYKRTPWQDLAAFGYSPDHLRQWIQKYAWEEHRLGDPDRTRIYWLR